MRGPALCDGGTGAPESDVVAELAEEDVLEVPSNWAPRTGTHLTRNLVVGHALGKGVQVANRSALPSHICICNGAGVPGAWPDLSQHQLAMQMHVSL